MAGKFVFRYSGNQKGTVAESATRGTTMNLHSGAGDRFLNRLQLGAWALV